MGRRQERAIPNLRAGVRQMLGEHDIRRQIRILRPESVADPRSQARKRNRGAAGVHGEDGLEVFDDVGVQRPDHAEIVGEFAEAREQLADHQARLPSRRELERRAQQRLIRRPSEIDRRHHLARISQEPRLVVKRIDMRHTAGHEDHEEILGLRRGIELHRRDRPAAIERPGSRERRDQSSPTGGGGPLENFATLNHVSTFTNKSRLRDSFSPREKVAVGRMRAMGDGDMAAFKRPNADGANKRHASLRSPR